MELGRVGFGRVGARLVRRLVRDGHTVVADGAIGASDLDKLAARLSSPRAIWVTVSGATVGQPADRSSQFGPLVFGVQRPPGS